MTDEAQFAQAVEVTIATYDRIAANYAERNAEARGPLWSSRMESFLDLLRSAEEQMPIAALPFPGSDAEMEEYLATVPVLDAGCGAGRDARALAVHGLPVLAVDLSQAMLDEARARTAQKLPQGMIRYALMDLRRLELPDACCRGVWCSASLVHVPRHVAPRAVGELARVARRGAPLAVFLKLAGQGAEQRFNPYEHLELPDAWRFYAYYSPDEARQLIEGAGFAVRDLETWTGDPQPPDAPGWVAVLATRL
jgi:SAM-dependent methyltransferase